MLFSQVNSLNEVTSIFKPRTGHSRNFHHLALNVEIGSLDEVTKTQIEVYTTTASNCHLL